MTRQDIFLPLTQDSVLPVFFGGPWNSFRDRPARFLELPWSRQFDRIQKQELLRSAHSASGLPTELLIVVMNFCQPCHWF